MDTVFPEASKVDCKDRGDELFCKIYSGHPSHDGTFLDERDVDYVEAEGTDDLFVVPNDSREDLTKPSEMGNVIFDVSEEDGCAFVEEREGTRLTCGSWLT